MLTSNLTDLARQSLAALRLLVVLTVVLGVGYPVAVWAAGRAVPDRAEGQPLRLDGEIVGSALLGQSFEGAQWFHSRPSPNDYDPLASAPSNLGPSNPDLEALIAERRASIAAAEGVPESSVPPDAVTGSGSGLDPHVSVAYAELQAPRVATANDLALPLVRRLVAEHTEGRSLGFLGEPGVNVVTLNLAVRQAAGPQAGGH